jgi:hypothetical protein
LETYKDTYNAGLALDTPYSLGKLIDWKLVFLMFTILRTTAPYSLGKLIDWKLGLIIPTRHGTIGGKPTPYSLGKLIDWKQIIPVACNGYHNTTPYSLGKLIDWKHNSV